jgi:hypothetical protein
MVFIFSYNRRKMLESILDKLTCFNPVILDDGSDFVLDYPIFVQFKHTGKEGFWEKYDHAFKISKKSYDDFFLFMQDDFLDLKLDKVRDLHNRFKNEPYVCNVINDGRSKCWNKLNAYLVSDDLYKTGFVDGSFFCNRSALSLIGFYIDPINKERFKNKSISSGVGQQLTSRFLKSGVSIYKPVKSLAYHGDYESLMNPESRKINKLISL